MLSALRVVRRLPKSSVFGSMRAAQFGGHGPAVKLRGPDNQRAKNEWNVDEEETPASGTDQAIATFLGFCCWFWIMISIKADNGKSFVSLIDHVLLN
jgi:hypothetical protein